jgi:four helix bundle protein
VKNRFVKGIALLSIYSNFGEGFERDGNREFAQFLSIAKGSIGETRGQLIYALDFESTAMQKATRRRITRNSPANGTSMSGKRQTTNEER